MAAEDLWTLGSVAFWERLSQVDVRSGGRIEFVKAWLAPLGSSCRLFAPHGAPCLARTVLATTSIAVGAAWCRGRSWCLELSWPSGQRSMGRSGSAPKPACPTSSSAQTATLLRTDGPWTVMSRVAFLLPTCHGITNSKLSGRGLRPSWQPTRWPCQVCCSEARILADFCAARTG